MKNFDLRNPPPRFLAIFKVLVFGLCLIPFARLIADGLADELGANPIEKITRTTGYWTLSFLLITLAVTPARKLSRLTWLGRFRRMLGLYAFFYGSLHFLTYVAVDQFFDLSAILKDITKRPYITVGFPAFVLLIPLAVTSTNAMIKRLGGVAWRRLHQLVYPIACCGVIHFWWLVKKDLTQPELFAAGLAVLLLFRLGNSVWSGFRRKISVPGVVAGKTSKPRVSIEPPNGGDCARSDML